MDLCCTCEQTWQSRHWADADQVGITNWSPVTQDVGGFSNEVDVNQNGDEDISEMTQSGTDDFAELFQTGTGNSVSVTQNVP